MLSAATLREMDGTDPLAAAREAFELPHDQLLLDANSFGAMPRSVPSAVLDLVTHGWGNGEIRDWPHERWLDLPVRVGAKIGALINAKKSEVVIVESVSIGLHKALTAALRAQRPRRALLVEKGIFPTDRYVAEELAREGFAELRPVDRGRLTESFNDDVAAAVVCHVDYRTGDALDLSAITAAAREHGALVVWDLSHSTGPVRTDVAAARLDLAVGAGNKYLSGGPGSPAYLFAAEHLHDRLRPSPPGWIGHENPFDFDQIYRPARGIRRFLSGTPALFGIAILEEALNVWTAVDREDVYVKCARLGDLLTSLLQAFCVEYGARLASPLEATQRGAMISVRHPDAQAIVTALSTRGVRTTFRPPDVIRLALHPLTVRYEDLLRCTDALHAVARDLRLADA